MAPPAAAALLAGMNDDERAARLLLATANPRTVAGIVEHAGLIAPYCVTWKYTQGPFALRFAVSLAPAMNLARIR